MQIVRILKTREFDERVMGTVDLPKHTIDCISQIKRKGRREKYIWHLYYKESESTRYCSSIFSCKEYFFY